MADFLATLEFENWYVHFLVPQNPEGRDQCIEPGEYEDAFEHLWLNALYQRYGVDIQEAPHFRRYVYEREGNYQVPRDDPAWSPFRRARSGLNDGKGMLFISSIGRICPSEQLPLAAGQYPHADVVEVYRNSELFKALRDPGNLKGRCRECEYHDICGGSRSRAYRLTGDYFASEPDCYNVAFGKEPPVPYRT